MQSQFKQTCRRLGIRLAQLRKRLRISQEELAYRAEIDRTYISQMERGVCNPSLLVLSKVAAVLEVKLVDCFEGVDALEG